MHQRWKRWPLAAVMFACAAAMAADKPADEEVPVKREKYLIEYVVQADGTYVETRDSRVRVLTESGVDVMRETTLTSSTSTETVEVLEAYVQKPDGRRVDVPKDNFQKSVDGGEAGGNPAFSDQTSLTVVFPDLAQGDMVAMKYRTIVRTPIFNNRFSTVEMFNAQAYEGDALVRIDAPASMQPRWKAYALTEASNTLRGDRRVVEWTWKNPTPVKSKRRDWSVYGWGDSPALLYSTFQDHAQIAAAYGERALPKAVPDARIRKLADDIAKGKAGERETAHALYDWVATNIRYAGNCIGLGAVVPRDTSFVLDNKMGDCKDHATLLQALLAAKGIDSKQALINASGSYTLPDVPVVSMVNHVINYLPSLDLYVDSTSDSTPFGWLPVADAGKPVLLVDAATTVAHTPANPNRNLHKVDTTMKVAADGTLDAKVTAEFGGMFAEAMRSMARNVDESDRKEIIQRVFQGHTAKGDIAWPDAKPLLDTHSFKADFTVDQLLPVPGAVAVSPPIFVPQSIGALAAAYARDADADKATWQTVCAGGKFEETYRIELADGLKLIAAPPAATIDSPALRYTSTVEQAGNSVTIHRVLEDHTQGPLCEPAFNTEFAAQMKKVRANVQAQLVYGLAE